MKCPRQTPMPSGIQRWLEEQLESRGIDSVYTIYIFNALSGDSDKLKDSKLRIVVDELSEKFNDLIQDQISQTKSTSNKVLEESKTQSLQENILRSNTTVQQTTLNYKPSLYKILSDKPAFCSSVGKNRTFLEDNNRDSKINKSCNWFEENKENNPYNKSIGEHLKLFSTVIRQSPEKISRTMDKSLDQKDKCKSWLYFTDKDKRSQDYCDEQSRLDGNDCQSELDGSDCQSELDDSDCQSELDDSDCQSVLDDSDCQSELDDNSEYYKNLLVNIEKLLKTPESTKKPSNSISTMKPPLFINNGINITSSIWSDVDDDKLESMDLDEKANDYVNWSVPNSDLLGGINVVKESIKSKMSGNWKSDMNIFDVISENAFDSCPEKVCIPCLENVHYSWLENLCDSGLENLCDSWLDNVCDPWPEIEHDTWLGNEYNPWFDLENIDIRNIMGNKVNVSDWSYIKLLSSTHSYFSDLERTIINNTRINNCLPSMNSAIFNSLTTLNHNKEDSSFTEVIPKLHCSSLSMYEPKFTETVGIEQTKEFTNLPSVSNYDNIASNKSEDLLTSMKTHFRPIKQDFVEIVTSTTSTRFPDGSTFPESNSLVNLNFNKSPEGSLYLDSDLNNKYKEYNDGEGCTPSQFVPKYLVRQNEKYCQTDQIVSTIDNNSSDVDSDDVDDDNGLCFPEKESWFKKMVEEDQVEEEDKTYWGGEAFHKANGGMAKWPAKKISSIDAKLRQIWKVNYLWSNELNQKEHDQLREEVSQEGEQLFSDLSHLIFSANENQPQKIVEIESTVILRGVSRDQKRTAGLGWKGSEYSGG